MFHQYALLPPPNPPCKENKIVLQLLYLYCCVVYFPCPPPNPLQREQNSTTITVLVLLCCSLSLPLTQVPCTKSPTFNHCTCPIVLFTFLSVEKSVNSPSMESHEIEQAHTFEETLQPYSSLVSMPHTLRLVGGTP